MCMGEGTRTGKGHLSCGCPGQQEAGAVQGVLAGQGLSCRCDPRQAPSLALLGLGWPLKPRPAYVMEERLCRCAGLCVCGGRERREYRKGEVPCGCLYGSQYVSGCPLGQIGTLSGPDCPSHLSPRLRSYRMIVGVGEQRAGQVPVGSSRESSRAAGRGLRCQAEHCREHRVLRGLGVLR